MDTRQEKLLKTIIETYINTAEPIGSKFLSEQGEFDLSGATLRNEMRELEETGYLVQPHTSAGRVPTEKGYAYYVEHLMEPIAPRKKIQETIADILSEASRPEMKLKGIARFAAEFTHTAVIVAIDRHSVYYTGISYMLAQPEFRNYAYTLRMSAVFDHCEDIMDDVYTLVRDAAPTILLGSHNPFGSTLGAVAERIGEESVFAIVGPIRMDYAKDAGVLHCIRETVR